jgi:hypothetical protein
MGLNLGNKFLHLQRVQVRKSIEGNLKEPVPQAVN